jgi:signal transduction histidine kinase
VNIGRKFFLSHFLAVLLVSGSIGSFFYWEAAKTIKGHLQVRLMHSAGLLAGLLDARTLAHLDEPGDIDDPVYQETLARLRAVKASNPDIAFLYVMRKEGDQVVFVLDTDDSEDQARPGQVYDEAVPMLWAGFITPSVDDQIYEDAWGAFLSGYAPLLNGEGRFLVGIDMRADEVQRKFHELRVAGSVSLGLSILLALIFSRMLATHFKRPIKLLVDRIGRMARGEYGAVIAYQSRDELDDLIGSVNTMSATLATTLTERENALEALAANNLHLERRVQERTRELSELNRRLQDQVEQTQGARQATQRANLQLMQAHKHETIGAMAGGLAHDFNNLLGVVVGQADLAALDCGGSAVVEARLHRIKEAAHHASELTKNLLLYAGKAEVNRVPTDLNGLLHQSEPLLRSAIPRTATLVLAPAMNLPLVSLDSTALRQAVMNLVLNAGEAIGDAAGTITLRTGQVEATRDFFASCYFHGETRQGAFVFVEVEDTGCGLPEGRLEQLFDPFFSTKQEGRGLGLAVVAGIVRAHHGAVRVRSGSGRGTCLTLYFPLAEIETGRTTAPGGTVAAGPVAPVGDGAAVAHGRVVLLVDDQPMIREMIETMLRLYGYEVVSAATGAEGIALFQRHRERIGLLIQDWSLPDMTGETVIQAVRGAAPDLPILVASGYLAEDILQRLSGYRIAGYIQKPFEMKRLLVAVERWVSAS